MTEVLADAAVAPVVEDVDFSLGETLPVAASSAADEFDFDLGAGELQASAATAAAPGVVEAKTAADTSAEISLDIDEIGYEEEGEHAEGVATPQLDLSATAEDIATEAIQNVDETVEAAEAAEEAVDLDVSAGDELQPEEDQGQAEEAHNDIDFSFEDAGDDAEHDDHDESMAYVGHDHEEHDHSEHGHEDHDHEEHGEEEHGHEEYDHEAHDDNEASEEEDADMSRMHTEEHGHDDSDDSGQEYDEDAENAGDNNYGASPYGSLNSGIGRLQAFDPATNLDVVVTWEGEVCPLFKAPDADDPDSFYLEDRDALDYPLSQFLQAIRNKISTYIAATDEIYIRVESLGLEFGETTTEALLSQVTFHNLLALHTTLVKNEDDDSMEIQGVHLTLGTRPNCLLRLKDLVSGAGQGLGLSDLQTIHQSSENSSVGSFNGDIELELEVEVSEDDDEDNEEEEEHRDAEEVDDEDGGDGNEYEDEEGVDADMAGNDSDGSENVHDDAEPSALDEEDQEDQEEESLNADDDEIEDGVNEVEFAAYNHDEGEEQEHGEDGEEAVGGLLFAAENTVPDGTTAEADGNADDALLGDGSDLLADVADDVNDAANAGFAGDAEQLNDLDLLEDIDDAGGLAGETGEDLLQQATDETALINDDDDFLDLGGDDLTGDLDGGALVADASDAIDANNVFTEANASLGTSATASLDHDEIDYEDNNGINNSNDDQGGVSLDVGGSDEIDWDAEVKNTDTLAGDSDAAPTTGSAKRTREVDESADDVLLDEPELKRQRADDVSL